ncbi:TIGR02221 family CRISPR-associated protein [Thiothrix lacustris]|jgi:CRISPR-associated Csx2 family protein|uniref:TIGR02221 family CRISPR-associated protein n=1 Tax=Thiothrix lacustris TaxID=525917 RepID=A0ABY9MU04_9GAMM|nr:TIGR02221 family CRISPR-associated protein [Thiothrix lacustris]WML91641.1 TIGR02221 family CRISPR-associated protein [Thiothrix lacustris]
MTQPLLISFLGKNTVASSKGYSTANYQIDGKSYTTAYFGFALAEHLRPEKILLLGTSGSMWDVLIEAHATDGQQEDARLRLMDMAQRDAVDEATLLQFAPLIEQHLGCPVEMKIIPYARDTDEQIAILSTIATHVPAGQAVVMDVTHGFRHLPMLGLVAAHYLERVKQVHVSALYYGALEMTTDRNTPAAKTPVLNLRGLLQTMDWIQAFAAYDASGNYAPFAELLPKEGWNENECNTLREAAFFERTTNVVKARACLSGLKPALERRGSAFLRLFGDELQKRLSWWKPTSRAEWEASLADTYYRQGDYLRASIFTQEACLSASMPPEQQSDFNDKREDNRKAMQKADGRFARLSDIRNGMAHGVKGWRQESAKVLQSEQSLRATLGDFIKNWRTLGK